VTSDRELLRDAAEEIAFLGRCLSVEPHLERWTVDNDLTERCIAADGLDQAIGVLDEFAAGRAASLADAARRLASTLPPPLD